MKPGLVIALLMSAAPATQLPAQISAASWTQRLDGVVNANEIDGWLAHEIDGGQLYLRRTGSLLEILIRTRPLLVASLCLATADRVSVLHASAALGSVTYTRSGSSFQTDQAFAWRMRETDMSAATQQRRLEYFTNEGWVANTTGMGTPGHVEWRVALDRYPAGDLFIALGLMSQSNPGQIAGWPQRAGACAHQPLVAGNAPSTLDFRPALWTVVPK
jgi:hypothetical protein